ncbi:hypothetical protein HYR99_30825 [Candidatus Poribacteria bacterium]|nr:hypothetical protein [Candidatus Poribacteria bacterium]
MTNLLNLEQAEKLVAQLPPLEQLKLVACICNRLSTTPSTGLAERETDFDKLNPAEQVRRERIRLAEELLAEVEDIEDDSVGEFDAAADIRRMREERIKQICQSDV